MYQIKNTDTDTCCWRCKNEENTLSPTLEKHLTVIASSLLMDITNAVFSMNKKGENSCLTDVEFWW